AADAHRPREVRAIPLASAAEVEDHGVAAFDAPLARLVVRRCAVRPGRDDREPDLVVSLLAQERPQVRADLALGAAREGPLEDARVRAIGGLGRGTQRLALVRVFALPQGPHD